jgi:hypothetical protein
MGFMKLKNNNNNSEDSLNTPLQPPSYMRQDQQKTFLEQSFPYPRENLALFSNSSTGTGSPSLPDDLPPLPLGPLQTGEGLLGQTQPDEGGGQLDVASKEPGSDQDNASQYGLIQPAASVSSTPEIPCDAPKQSLMDIAEMKDPAISHKDTSPSVSAKQVFIEMGKYRQIMKDLNYLRGVLKQSNDELNKLASDIKGEEKMFSKLHASFSGMEKKLIELEGGFLSQ